MFVTFSNENPVRLASSYNDALSTPVIYLLLFSSSSSSKANNYTPLYFAPGFSFFRLAAASRGVCPPLHSNCLRVQWAFQNVFLSFLFRYNLLTLQGFFFLFFCSIVRVKKRKKETRKRWNLEQVKQRTRRKPNKGALHLQDELSQQSATRTQTWMNIVKRVVSLGSCTHFYLMRHFKCIYIQYTL